MFLRTPLRLIGQILKHHSEHIKREANLSSISTARLTAVIYSIANGLSGDKSGKIPSLDELLPFPLNEEQYDYNKETTATVQKLIKRGALPLHVISALDKVIALQA